MSVSRYGASPNAGTGQETEERVGADGRVTANPKSGQITHSLQGWHRCRCPVFHSESPFTGLDFVNSGCRWMGSVTKSRTGRVGEKA